MAAVDASGLVATLARLRRERGISQAQIARLAGYRRGAVARWEEGHYPAALDLAAAWAGAVGYDLVLVPRMVAGAPSELSGLVAALASLHTTPPDDPIEG